MNAIEQCDQFRPHNFEALGSLESLFLRNALALVSAGNGKFVSELSVFTLQVQIPVGRLDQTIITRLRHSDSASLRPGVRTTE